MSLAAPTEGVLGVLEQFEDEVRVIVLQACSQLSGLLRALGAVALPVLLANCLVVR